MYYIIQQYYPSLSCVLCNHYSQHTGLQSSLGANPARGVRQKNNDPLSPFAPENFVSRDRLGRPVARILHTSGIIESHVEEKSERIQAFWSSAVGSRPKRLLGNMQLRCYNKV